MSNAMDEMQLLLDLHGGNERQGPGGEDQTRRAIALAGLEAADRLQIADIGCGTGASTRVLAAELNAHLTAVDLFPEFLVQVEAVAAREGWRDRLTTLAASMDQLPFEEGQFDLIWSEGAIYNMGFKAGIQAWRRFLKPGGVLAVSELSWFTATRPEPLQAHWDREYPEVGTVSEKLAALEEAGYRPEGYFALSEESWTRNYYGPLEAVFDAFLERNGHSEAARAIIDAEREEIAFYKEYKAYFGYGFYIARKVDV